MQPWSTLGSERHLQVRLPVSSRSKRRTVALLLRSKTFCHFADLSALVEEASRSESFMIAKAGKPLVKVTALSAPTSAQVGRLGFLAGEISVPDDFDRMGWDRIEGLFGGGV